jgi:membrane fusion protein (multidrug efflux system)
VHVGETLFKIDDRPFTIAVEEAEARMASARLSVAALKATYHEGQADLRTAESALDYAQRELARQTRLLSSGISSQAQVDRALAARNEAQGKVGSVREEITATLASLGGDPNILADKHPTVLAAQATLDRAKLNLSYTIITAPIEGIVTRVEQLQAGNYIKDAAPAFALVSTHDVWVEANFKEVQLTHMKVGQLATVRFDAYPGHDFRAKVTSVSPGTGSEFSVLPPENASGNWVKVVQRLPVRFELEEQLPAARSGLSAVVTVDTRSLDEGKRLQTAGAATGS